MRSTNRLTNSFPCNQDRALAGSFFGKWPSPKSDFMRLKANSTCQRSRYNSRIDVPENVDGRVVQREKYWAASQDSRLTFSCRLLVLLGHKMQG
jgi:hypothetical protein